MKNELLTLSGGVLSPNSDKLQSSIAFFHRRFKMKHCLPEMPSKTFYTWKNEGIIHCSFGKRKDIDFEDRYGAPLVLVYERYNVYELIWIRLIYHLRLINYPKETLAKATDQYFTKYSVEVHNTIIKKRISLTDKVKAYAKSLSKDIDKRGLDHELDKLLVAFGESMFTTDYHKCLYIALTTQKDLYFIISDAGIKCCQEEVGSYQNITKTLTHQSSSPITVIKFSTLFQDLLQVSETDFIKKLILANEEQGRIIDEWKNNLLPFEEYRASPKSLSPTKDYFLNLKNSYE